jgi:hypothetical protein
MVPRRGGCANPDGRRESGRRAKMIAMSDEPTDETIQDSGPQPVVQRVVSAIDDAVHGAASAIEGGANAARDATTRRLADRPGARVRAVRRRGREPLPMLYEVHPEARRATPHELGLQTIDAADVAGTAVGGARQRGGDFLPLKPFRSDNWNARWQRLRSAADRLAILPPIDVVRFGDRYWVLDGHNRVASALYGGQLSIDANVTDLRLPGEARSEPPSSLAAQVEEHRDLRAALSRRAIGPGADPAGGVDGEPARDTGDPPD